MGFLGPLLWNREPPADAADFVKNAVPDYYQSHRQENVIPPADDEEHAPTRALSKDAPQRTQTIASDEAEITEKPSGSDRDTTEQAPAPKKVGLAEVDGPKIEGAWYASFFWNSRLQYVDIVWL